MTLPLFEPTYTVSQLGGEIQSFLGEAFQSVWVAGEAQRVRLSAKGHLYFELVEKGEHDEVVGKLEAVVWRTEHQRVRRALAAGGQQIADGLQLRCRASIDFYSPSGRLQLVVREVDPVFTLGVLAQRRLETLEALRAAGLLERNKGLLLPDLPLRIGLVTSEGSAAYHDFLSTLRESGYGFRVIFVHAAVQGRDSEREIVSALSALAEQPIGCVVLVRGGGARSDLQVFDSRGIAEAVAGASFPVLTGLGHEIDQSIADLVAHTAMKTPTKAAEFLVEVVARGERRFQAAAQRLRREAGEPLRRGRDAVTLMIQRTLLAAKRLAEADTRLGETRRALARTGRERLLAAGGRSGELRRRLAAAAPRALVWPRREPARLTQRLLDLARGRLSAARGRLEERERLVRGLAPERTLRLGYSITRNATGRLLRAPEQTELGERIVTRLAGGLLASRVEEA